MSLGRILFVVILVSGSWHASADERATRSRLLATGGASDIEGSAGGGIVPMALLSGYGAQEEQGGTAFATYLDTGDYQLQVVGASWSYHNRFEVSYAEQELTHNSLTRALNLPVNSIRQRIVGAKLRLAGDLIYTPIPQFSLGLEYKQNRDFFVPSTVGARADSGTDFNLTATKLFLNGVLGRNLLINGNLRYTKANQAGLVGFGGDKNDRYALQPEVSVGLLLNKHWLLGGEYRSKPNNLSALKEDDWRTLFMAWFPNKNIALVTAYADLGEVASFRHQSGWYLSLQGSF